VTRRAVAYHVPANLTILVTPTDAAMSQMLQSWGSFTVSSGLEQHASEVVDALMMQLQAHRV
jgi:hypothetical protein